jgi:protein-disulfide isomerase
VDTGAALRVEGPRQLPRRALMNAGVHAAAQRYVLMIRKAVTSTYLLLWLVAMTALCLPTNSPAQGIQLITAEGQKEMLTDPGTDAAGAPNADVTIVEYFDYNCPYCKKLVPALQSLLAEDHKVAIVYKDWPVLGEVSVYAARSALAARWQGKYLRAHDALMNGPRFSQNDQVDATLKSAGIDIDTLRKDQSRHAKGIDALLARNNEEAHALNLRGTPGIVVGRQLLPGFVDLIALRRLVADSRHES